MGDLVACAVAAFLSGWHPALRKLVCLLCFPPTLLETGRSRHGMPGAAIWYCLGGEVGLVAMALPWYGMADGNGIALVWHGSNGIAWYMVWLAAMALPW
jgi:hypothetical protein